MATEVTITDPSTGGMKGRKPERYELIPWEAMDEVARVYAFGATKYDDDNWRKGYSWRLSIGALIRHVKDFVIGRDKDEESGLHPLAHAVFHCLALITWATEHPEKDDRYRPVPPRRPVEVAAEGCYVRTAT